MDNFREPWTHGTSSAPPQFSSVVDCCRAGSRAQQQARQTLPSSQDSLPSREGRKRFQCDQNQRRVCAVCVCCVCVLGVYRCALCVLCDVNVCALPVL